MMQQRVAVVAMCFFLASIQAAAGNAPAQDTAAPAAPVPTPGRAAFDPNRPIARVGDTIITAAQFQRELRFRWMVQAQRTGKKTPPTEEFREQVLEEVVNAVVVRQLARAEGLQPDEAAAARRFRDFVRIRGQEAVEEYLAREDITEAQLKEQLREQTLVDAYIKKLRAETEPKEEDLRAQYESLKQNGRLNRPRVTYDVAHIFIEAKDDSEQAWQTAREALDAAHARVRAGESFEALAAEVSDDEQAREMGGVYYEARPEEVPQAIREVMILLDEGEVSEPFKSPLGWHLLKMLDENPAGEEISFEKARFQISQALEAGAVQTRLREKVEAYSNLVDIEFFREVSNEVPLGVAPGENGS